MSRYIAKLGKVLVGRQDGTVTLHGGDHVASVLLTGPDTDPVYSAADDGHNIYIGCRDGTVRKYNFNKLLQ